MKSAGKARNNGLYRHIRTSKEIIRNLLNDYYNNEKHELFDTAVLPTDELGDEDWQFGEMSLSDFSGDYNSDLRLTLFHEDMSESYIVWEWEKGAGYLYRPSDSYFRESRVVDEPPADDILTEQT